MTVSQLPTALLLSTAVTAGVTVVIAIVFAWHLVRRVLDVPRVPLSGGAYALMGVLGLVCGAAAFLGGAIAASLGDWSPLPPAGAVAEVRCQRSGGSLALTFVPLEGQGLPGPAESLTVGGRDCDVAGEVLDFVGPLSWLGLGSVHRVSRLGDYIRPPRTPAWRALPRPFGLDLARLRHEATPVPASDRARYRVLVRDGGYWLEKLDS